MTSNTTRPSRHLVVPLLGLLLLLSTACTVRFNTDVVLSEDDTATVGIIVGVRFDTELPPEATEGMEELNPDDSAAEVQAAADECGFDPDAVSATEYAEDDFMGVELTLTDIPIESVNCFFGDDADSPFEEFSITRDGDDYVFNATAPPLGNVLGEMGGELGGQKRQVAQSELEDFEQGLEDAFGEGPTIEAEVSITFPGSVGENNGDSVDGNTVTWELQLEQATTMMAVGSATPGGGGSGLLIPIIIAVVVVILLLVLLLVLRGRKDKGQPVYAGQPGPGGPPQQGGFGARAAGAPPQQGGYGAPPGAAPPPQGGYGAPPSGQPQPAPPQGGFGGPPGGGQPPPPQGGFSGPPGGEQPAPPPPQQPTGGDQGGGGDSGSTRTFRPEDLLPPQDPDNKR